MEDALSIHSWDGHSLVGVCDGHGDDSKVSTMIASEVKNVYLRQSSALSEHDRWSLTCLALDELVRKSGFPGGSTGIWACIKNNSIVVINVGDCRGVLVQEDPTISTEDDQNSSFPSSLEDSVVNASDSKIMDELTEKCSQVSLDDTNPKIHSKMPFLVVPLSTDQKPDLPSERERIEGAGLTVTQESFIDEHGLKKYVPKILLAPGHSMAVARSFGDFEYKSNSNLSPEQQALIAIPEVMIHERSPRDLYLILACDGVWDVMTNKEVCEFVVTHVDKMIEDDESDVLPKVGDLLLSKCLELGSKDNMSVVIVGLSATANKVESSGLMKGKALQF
jgi:serine/threonine protein phosphatase PrpC